jgi:hypothetical protein
MTTEPNSVHFEFVTSKESSLDIEEHINQKEIAMLDFPEVGLVIHFTSDYHATNQQVQAEEISENQILENQHKGGEKESVACRREVISSNPGGNGLTAPNIGLTGPERV